MQTSRDAQTLKRLLLFEALADLAQDRHLAFSPINTTTATFGLVNVLDIVIAHCYFIHCYSYYDLPVGRVGPMTVKPISRPTYYKNTFVFFISTMRLISHHRQNAGGIASQTPRACNYDSVVHVVQGNTLPPVNRFLRTTSNRIRASTL